ncbi:MAG: hypothetical protein ABR503_03920 [Chitinophagaceae bacterium]
MFINSSLSGKAQDALTFEGQKCYGGTQSDPPEFIKFFPDGSFISCGSSNSINGDVEPSVYNTAIWVFKANKEGTILWQKRYGGNRNNFESIVISDVELTQDGGCVIVGNTNLADGDFIGVHGPVSDGQYEYDGFIIKLSSAGTTEWLRCVGGSSYEFITSVTQSPSGSFILVGQASSYDGDVSGYHGAYYDYPSDGDGWVVKINSNGMITEQRCYGGLGFDAFTYITNAQDNGFFVVGHTRSKDGDVSGFHTDEEGTPVFLDTWVLKLHENISLNWQKCIGGVGREQSLMNSRFAPPVTSDGGIIISGTTTSNDGDMANVLYSSNYFFIKLSSMGIIDWKTFLGPANSGELNGPMFAIEADGGGSLLFAVHNVDFINSGNFIGNRGGTDAFIGKINSASGQLQWIVLAPQIY